jgi:hypothetical protein
VKCSSVQQIERHYSSCDRSELSTVWKRRSPMVSIHRPPVRVRSPVIVQLQFRCQKRGDERTSKKFHGRRFGGRCDLNGTRY